MRNCDLLACLHPQSRHQCMISYGTAEQLRIHIPYLRMHHRERGSFCHPATTMSTKIETHTIKHKAHWTHFLGTSIIDFQCFKLTISFGELYWRAILNFQLCSDRTWEMWGTKMVQHWRWATWEMRGIRRLHCLSEEKLEMLDSIACMCNIQVWS